jgi:hypothetical protein
MTEQSLGRLEPVDLRDIWVDGEAASFTPWLARSENLAVLGRGAEHRPAAPGIFPTREGAGMTVPSPSIKLPAPVADIYHAVEALEKRYPGLHPRWSSSRSNAPHLAFAKLLLTSGVI